MAHRDSPARRSNSGAAGGGADIIEPVRSVQSDAIDPKGTLAWWRALVTCSGEARRSFVPTSTIALDTIAPTASDYLSRSRILSIPARAHASSLEALGAPPTPMAPTTSLSSLMTTPPARKSIPAGG